MSVGRPKRAEPIDTVVGERIRQARLWKGYTQKYLAELLAVSTDSVRNWERSRAYPNEEKVFSNIATALNVDKFWLMNKDTEIDISRHPLMKSELLRTITTDELLAELKRRTEAP